MTKQNINAFVEGEKVNTLLLITGVTRGVTTSGAPYASLTLQDQTGSIEAKVWDVKDEQANVMIAGKVVNIAGEVLKYRNALQLRVFNVTAMEEGEFDPADFVSGSDLSNEYMKQRIEGCVDSMQDEVIRGVCQDVLQYFGDKIYSYPAAARNHHDFVGGLATHMIGMLDIAEALCKQYPILNRDLLVSGVLLHDLGKIIELSGPILTEYTLEGKLVGHISIMQSLVVEIAKKRGFEASEQVVLMRHLILSHHGEYEFGSPILPMIMEAEILNFVDNIDARMNMFQKALDPIEEGQFTPRVFSLENRAFYKPSYQTKK
ncbi:MAG: 3'-5' exoribonuclease YhaM family protein [Erysipelotrichaceae bacterium]